MLISSPLQEMRRREAALRIINLQVKRRGRSHLYDLTGLAGGFPLQNGDISLLETYAGPAIFEEALKPLAKKHLGGEKFLALNRTSSGILATILALVKPGSEVVHYLPLPPSHPSIPRSVELVGGKYREFDDLNQFKVGKKTSLVIITGSTMDHQIIPEHDFLKVIEISKKQGVPVFVDDASGARLRTIIYNQPRATDMGADLVVTSTDKLMDGPRGGLMAGNADLIDLIKSKSHQFGLEAQPPIVAGMVRALENFTPERILKAVDKKIRLYQALKGILKVKETPTGVMLSPDDLIEELKQFGVKTSLYPEELANLFAMILLRKYHIITIPAVGMPGASPTIRLDMASRDAERIDINYIINALKGTIEHLFRIIEDEKACRETLYK